MVVIFILPRYQQIFAELDTTELAEFVLDLAFLYHRSSSCTLRPMTNHNHPEYLDNSSGAIV